MTDATLPAPPAAPVPRRLPFDLSKPVLVAVVLLLAVMIVLPVGWLVVYSLSDKQGGFTLGNFATLFTDPTFVDPLVTTLILATSVAAICCLVAAPMGWLVARTDMPIRRTVRTLVMASLVTPPFGLSMFLMCKMANVSIEDFSREALPFILCLVGVLVVLIFVPDLVLWLPNAVMGAEK